MVARTTLECVGNRGPHIPGPPTRVLSPGGSSWREWGTNLKNHTVGGSESPCRRQSPKPKPSCVTKDPVRLLLLSTSSEPAEKYHVSGDCALKIGGLLQGSFLFLPSHCPLVVFSSSWSSSQSISQLVVVVSLCFAVSLTNHTLGRSFSQLGSPVQRVFSRRPSPSKSGQIASSRRRRLLRAFRVLALKASFLLSSHLASFTISVLRIPSTSEHGRFT